MTDTPEQPGPPDLERKPTLVKRLTFAPAKIRAVRPGLEQARQGSPVLDATLACVERDSDIGGGILAGALAYRLFLFFVPLVFFGLAVLGLISDTTGRDPRTVAHKIGLVAVVSKQVATTSESRASVWVGLTSFVVLVYVTRVLHRAVAVVHALAWEHSAASARSISRSLLVFSLGVLAQLGLSAGVGAVREQGGAAGALALIAYIPVSAAIWLAVSLRLPHGRARWVDLLPGSFLYATGLLGVHIFNVYLLERLVQTRASTYGTLGAAAGLLLGLFFVGRIVIGAAVLNATLFERRAGAVTGD